MNLIYQQNRFLIIVVVSIFVMIDDGLKGFPAFQHRNEIRNSQERKQLRNVSAPQPEVTEDVFFPSSENSSGFSSPKITAQDVLFFRIMCGIFLQIIFKIP